MKETKLLSFLVSSKIVLL